MIFSHYHNMNKIALISCTGKSFWKSVKTDPEIGGGGGSLGPQSYFQLILTSFWTHGTIIDQFIVKGVHQ